MPQVLPALGALTPEQMDLVHQKVLAILEQTGIRVENPGAREVFRRAGCREIDGGRFALAPEIVEDALEAAPSRIELFDRHGAPAFTMDASQPRAVYGVGVTNLYYQEILSDNVVPFGREHMALTARLGQALPEFDTISTPGVIQDMPGQPAELIGALEMLANTNKPIVLLVSKPEAFKASLDMYDELAGLDGQKPFVLPYLNPITPLILNDDTSRKMDLALERGLPVIFSNYGHVRGHLSHHPGRHSGPAHGGAFGRAGLCPAKKAGRGPDPGQPAGGDGHEVHGQLLHLRQHDGESGLRGDDGPLQNPPLRGFGRLHGLGAGPLRLLHALAQPAYRPVGPGRIGPPLWAATSIPWPFRPA